jgi:sugar phosphate isomerase/epimerase
VTLIGFSSCCFPKNIAMEDILAFSQRHQFNAFELALNDANFDPANLNKALCERIRRMACGGNICFSLHGPEEGNFSDANPQKRNDAIREMNEAIRLAKDLCIPKVIVHPGQVDGTVTKESLREAFRQNVEGIRQCFKTSKSLGVKISLENLCHQKASVTPHIQDFMELYRCLASSEIGITLDTGHAALVDGIVKTVQEIGSYADHIHFNSNSGQRSDHVEPRKGLIDFYEIADYLRSFNGTTIIELNDIGDESGEAILRSRTYLLEMQRATVPIERKATC